MASKRPEGDKREGTKNNMVLRLDHELAEQLQLLSGYAGGREPEAEAVERDLEEGLYAALAGVFAENRSLRAEVGRLRELLRRHGIEPDEPDGGESRSA